MTENERLKLLQKEFNFSNQTEFAEFLGIKQGSLSDIYRSKDGIGVSDTIKRKLNKELSINIDWLETGNGKMYEEPKEQQTIVTHSPEDFRLVPMYNMDARGCFDTNDEVDCIEYIVDTVPFKDAKDKDICVPVSGKSMMPTYSPGTVILLREVEQWREFLETGQVYVLVLIDGRRLLKELRRSEEDRKNNYLCISHNPDFEPVELPRKFIKRVFLVKAMYQKTTI